ncbi:MAG: hypothetical protein ACTSVL_12210 [Promethearchaeota archaeon]
MTKTRIIGAYYTPEILELLIVERVPVIIKYYEYEKYIFELEEILKDFFKIDYVDSAKILQMEYFDIFLSNNSEDAEYRKTLTIIKNLTDDHLKILAKYPDFHFIGLMQRPSYLDNISPSIFKQVAIYNQKTKGFDELCPNNLLKGKKNEKKWVEQKIIFPVQNGEFNIVHDYISKFLDSINKLIEKSISTDISINKMDFSKFTETEQFVIKKIIKNQLGLNEQIQSQPLQSQPLQSQLLLPREPKNLDSGNDNKISSEIQKSKQKEKENSQIFTELFELQSHALVYLAFNICLEKIVIKDDLPKKFILPEEKYLYLREHQWKKEIPASFFENIFLLFCRERIKSARISESSVNEFLKIQFEFFFPLVEHIAPQEFLNFSNIAIDKLKNDRDILDHLVPEDPVKGVLPFKNQNSFEESKYQQNNSQIINLNNFNGNEGSLIKSTGDKLPTTSIKYKQDYSFREKYLNKLSLLRKEFSLKDHDIIRKIGERSQRLLFSFINFEE